MDNREVNRVEIEIEKAVGKLIDALRDKNATIEELEAKVGDLEDKVSDLEEQIEQLEKTESQR